MTEPSALSVETSSASEYRPNTFFATLVAVWDKIDSALAWCFGLDQSKYQWAVDTYKYQKYQEERAESRAAEQFRKEQEKQDIAMSNVESQSNDALSPDTCKSA